jgi:hypothetical protein
MTSFCLLRVVRGGEPLGDGAPLEYVEIARVGGAFDLASRASKRPNTGDPGQQYLDTRLAGDFDG